MISVFYSINKAKLKDISKICLLDHRQIYLTIMWISLCVCFILLVFFIIIIGKIIMMCDMIFEQFNTSPSYTKAKCQTQTGVATK